MLKTKNKKETKINSQLFDEAVLSFQAPEYVQHEKSLAWYIVAGVVAFALVYYGLATDGWTFSMAIIVFAGTYYLFHKDAPPIIAVKISKMGVKIGRHIFPYSQIKNYWIVYDPPHVTKLYLRMTSRIHPDIYVSLNDADPVEVRHALTGHVKEAKGVREPFTDALTRLLKL